MDVSWEVPKDRESDIDEEIGTASCDAVDADGWDYLCVSSWNARSAEVKVVSLKIVIIIKRIAEIIFDSRASVTLLDF